MKKIISGCLILVLLCTACLTMMACGDETIVPTVDSALGGFTNALQDAQSGTLTASLNLSLSSNMMTDGVMTYSIPFQIKFEKTASGVNWDATLTLPEELQETASSDVVRILCVDGEYYLDNSSEEHPNHFVKGDADTKQVLDVLCDFVDSAIGEIGSLGSVYTLEVTETEKNTSYALVSEKDVSRDINDALRTLGDMADMTIGEILIHYVWEDETITEETLPDRLVELLSSTTVASMEATLNEQLAPKTWKEALSETLDTVKQLSGEGMEEWDNIVPEIEKFFTTYGEESLLSALNYLMGDGEKAMPDEEFASYLKEMMMPLLEIKVGDIPLASESVENPDGSWEDVVTMTLGDIMDTLGTLSFKKLGLAQRVELNAEGIPYRGSHTATVSLVVSQSMGITSMGITVEVAAALTWELHLGGVTVALPADAVIE